MRSLAFTVDANGCGRWGYSGDANTFSSATVRTFDVKKVAETWNLVPCAGLAHSTDTTEGETARAVVVDCRQSHVLSKQAHIE